MTTFADKFNPFRRKKMTEDQLMKLIKAGKRMSMVRAREVLKAMADGEYYTLTYTFGEFRTDDTHHDCSVYINNQNFHKGATWEEALLSLQRAMNPKKKDINDVEFIDE